MNGFGKPAFGVPGGEVKVENPDGIMWTEGDASHHNLYNTGGTRPAIPSGDWKTRDRVMLPGDDPAK